MNRTIATLGNSVIAVSLDLSGPAIAVADLGEVLKCVVDWSAVPPPGTVISDSDDDPQEEFLVTEVALSATEEGGDCRILVVLRDVDGNVVVWPAERVARASILRP